MTITISPLALAARYAGVREIVGNERHHPLIVWWLSRCHLPAAMLVDETPWCSAFVSGVCWELGVERSDSAASRSWLKVGTAIALDDAKPGFDLVVFTRAGAPDPAVAGPGHVGFYVGRDATSVQVLGGNQSNGVNVASFPRADVLGVRRLRVTLLPSGSDLSRA